MFSHFINIQLLKNKQTGKYENLYMIKKKKMTPQIFEDVIYAGVTTLGCLLILHPNWGL